MSSTGTITKIAASVLLVAVVTAALAPFADSINHTTTALAFLLAILFAATLFGSRAALVSSAAAALCFNFFFLPPYYTFAVHESENWVAFGAFVITAAVAGQLSSYARRRAEESEQRRREIEKLYEDLRGAFAKASEAEALRQSEQMKSALLDAVTHDLRTPLTSIKAAATTLMETKIDLGDETRRDLLAIIVEETDRLNRFIGGIVDLARIEAGQLELRGAVSSVSEMVARAVQRAAARLADREVRIDIPADAPDVRFDGSSGEEALFALIENAAKYSPAGTPIRVTARMDTDAVQVAVEDQGKGLAAQDRDKVFEKFVRLSEDEIHSTEGGLGLGLSIARGLAESQGGSVHATDGSDGFRTAFILRMPTADPDPNGGHSDGK